MFSSLPILRSQSPIDMASWSAKQGCMALIWGSSGKLVVLLSAFRQCAGQRLQFSLDVLEPGCSGSDGPYRDPSETLQFPFLSVAHFSCFEECDLRGPLSMWSEH